MMAKILGLNSKCWASSAKKDDLPPESLSSYYEERKKIIFKKMSISNDENELLKFLKQSQLIVNEKYLKIKGGGFFQSLPVNHFELSNSIKENISNYCLIFSLYFNEGDKINALKLFLLMCQHNTDTIKFLTRKIMEQLPKISNTNRIAKYYPTITKTTLQILSIFIKLSGKFHKSALENLYINLYFKIIYILSITVIKCNPANSDEINNQLKNERRYFYSSCLFDSSIYLFNRFQPLSICIYILQHILELYGNKLTFVPTEIESILLLKVNYNLGLFYYINGNNNESIFNLNQARDRLLEIKYFPISKSKYIHEVNEENDLNNNKFTNSTNNIYNYNEFFTDFQNIKISRNKFKRLSINSNEFNHNEKNAFNRKTLISMIKEKNLLSKEEYESKKNYSSKQYSTIFLGANSLLNFQNPILKEQVKEKIFIEIEFLLSEIELNHKNYKESLNHINTILTLQSLNSYNKNNENSIEYYNLRESKIISKSKTVNINNLITKNSTSSNGIVDSEENIPIPKENKYIITLKNKIPLESSISLNDKKKLENNNNNIFSKFKNLKYHLSAIDKKRIIFILEQIENANNENHNNTSDNKIQIIHNKNRIRRNESLNKDKKIITSKEMEKFFIFLCGLSLYQLKILNETQPEPSQRRNDLPIIFSNQFQDCLTNAQRMSLNALETMSLIRYVILRDTNKDICPENLDYRFMKYRIKETDSDEESNRKVKYTNNMLNNEKKRKSSNESNGSNNTLNNNINFGSQKFLCVPKFSGETEEICFNIGKVLNNIKNDENKNFIDLYKGSIIKLLSQMNKEEIEVILNNPKLLKQLINNISEKFKIKENGGNNNNNSNNISNYL